MAKGIERLDGLLKAASNGQNGIRKLNFVMSRAIPFNKPHGIGVREVSGQKVIAQLPYKRKNLNHLKGLHASAIMTVGEYCSGIFLMKRAGGKYRLIMKSVQIDYHKQGRTDAVAIYEMTDQEFNSLIMDPLNKDGVVMHTCKVKVYDDQMEVLADVNVEWQIKDWKMVRYKKNQT